MSDDKPQGPRWYTIKEAAEYLNIGEPTIYRWMRDNKITFRKIGDSTRFLKEDLDAVVQVFHSDREVDKVQAVCPACHHDRLVEGRVQSTGLLYFRPKKTKFWTFKDTNIDTHAKMCPRCGAIVWFGDAPKLRSLHEELQEAADKQAAEKTDDSTGAE
ncbi:MAG: helix-turn-helix domain-containing protein [Verrucomicrobiota bacterium]